MSENNAVEVDIQEVHALNGVPDFYDLPAELNEVIEKKTMTSERMFWLRASSIEKDKVNTILLRRAMYAESRCFEMENRLGELALIVPGMKEEIERLQDQLTVLASATS